MLLSAVLVSEGDKRVSENKDIKAAKCRINNGGSSSYVIDRQ